MPLSRKSVYTSSLFNLYMNPLAVPLQFLPFGLTVSTALQILLTTLLAGLYYLMYKTQQRQADIQETQNQIIGWQTQLMSAEQQPELVPQSVGADENALSVELSNLGEGRARNLKALCRLYHKEGDDYLTAFSMKVLGFVITPVKTELTRIKQKEFVTLDMDDEYSVASHNGIDAKEGRVRFEGEIKQEIRSVSPVMEVTFTRAIEQMRDEWDVEVIGLDLYLTYEDVIDQEHSLRVESRKGIETKEGMSLADALEGGEEIDKPVSTLVPESSKPSGMREEEEATT